MRPASHIKRPPRPAPQPVLGTRASARDELRERVLTITKRGRFTPAQIAGALGISVGDEPRFLTILDGLLELRATHRTRGYRVVR